MGGETQGLTPEDGDRYCPVFGCEIDGEICYESALCLFGQFKNLLHLSWRKF